MIDPAGDLYVAGTSSSGALVGTAGAAIPEATAGTTNSFVAKFSPALSLDWLTFSGGSRIVASALAANAFAVYVAGTTYGADLPVSQAAVEPVPASGSMQNGFVESFSADGSTLSYATYLTGTNGDTTPAGIAVDSAGDAWLVGETSASGFPTVAALIPDIVSNPSGFALELTPAGDSLTWSTFVPGAGLSAIALDPAGGTLWIAGAVALGEFPVDTVAMRLVPTTYQVLLRMTADGSAVESGTVIAPGAQSTLAPGGDGGAWIGGEFAAETAPMLPSPTLAQTGDGYAVHVASTGTIDQTARFGGLPQGNLAFASLPLSVSGLAVDPAAELVLAGAIAPTASATLLGSQRYELALRNAPTAALPSAVSEGAQAAGTCGGSLCAGSSGFLAKLNLTFAHSAFAFAADALPRITFSNLGSAPAGDLVLTSTAGTLSSTCPAMLPPGGQCDLLLAGGSAGLLTATTSSGDVQTLQHGTYAAPGDTLVFDPKELDFGIQTASSAAGRQTVTVSNLGPAPQTFVSGDVAPGAPSPFSEAVSDCTQASDGSRKVLAAGASCHITLAFSAASAALDGFVSGQWPIGEGQVFLTGYEQSASLSVSANVIDFGTVLYGGLMSPRFLYLSNSGDTPAIHTPLTLPANSPFTVTDSCSALLQPKTACRLRIDYASLVAPAVDSVTLTLDQGLTVPLTGATVLSGTAPGSPFNPDLRVTPASAAFTTPVVVTQVSSSSQTVTIANTGKSTLPLSLAILGDFTQTSNCAGSLTPGATCSVAVSFVPSQPGLRNGLLSLTGGAGSAPEQIRLSGFGAAIFAGGNGTLGFGPDPIGQPLVQFYKVTQPFTQLSVATSGPYLVTLIEDTGLGHGQPPLSDYVSAGSGTCLNCWVAVLFDPVAPGAQAGTLRLSSTSGGSPYLLQLSGTGLAVTGLIVTPAMQDFGPVPVDSTSGSALVSLTNLSSSGEAITLSAPIVSNPFSLLPAPLEYPGCAASLAYSDTCVVSVAFTPNTPGATAGTLTWTTSAGIATANLSGTGIPDPGVALTPASLTFSPGSATQSVRLQNLGTASLQVGNPATGTASFASSSTCASLAPGGVCTVTVVFTPGAQPVSDTLTIPITNGSGAAAQTVAYLVPLTGAYAASAAGLTLSPATAQFGPSVTGQVGPARIFTLTNLTPVNLSLSTSVPAQFAVLGTPCSALVANGTCTFTLASVPLVNGAISGSLVVNAIPASGDPSMTALSYAESYGVGSGTLTLGGGLIVESVFNFGQIASGQTASQTFTLTAGPTAPVTVRRLTTAAPFAVSSTCEASLAAGASCSVTVSYAPLNQVTGGTVSAIAIADSGQLTIESDAETSPAVLLLAGQAGPAAVAAPSNHVSLTGFTLSSQSLSFAETAVGDQSAAQPLILTNSGTAALHIGQVSATSDFAVTNHCAIVAPGEACSIDVESTPQTAGTHIAALAIVSDASTSLDFVSLLSVGIASPLTFSPASLDFGEVLLGSAATLPVSLANTGSTPLAITSIAATGDYAAGGDCPISPATLASAGSCTVQVTFSPAMTGTRSGVLSVVSSSSTRPLTINLTGTGTASQLVITPGSLAFGSIATGASASLPLTLTNQGTAPVNHLVLSVGSPYAVTLPCTASTLAVGASCTVELSFSPAIVGAQDGTLRVSSSDPQSPALIPLTGTGIANAGFLLTVAGGTSETLSIGAGSFATFSLTAAPLGSFAGSVALTCLPLETVQYANCSLLTASLMLAGGPAAATATVNTITLGSGVANAPAAGWLRPIRSLALALLVSGMLLARRGNRRPWSRLLRSAALLTMLSVSAVTGCGSSSNAHYTSPGTYSFQVTANSTSGVVLTQSVTLTVIVTAR